MKCLLAGSRGTGNKAASTTGYGAFAGLSGSTAAGAESGAEMRVETPGVFSGFGVRVNVNTRGASSYTFRKNGADGNQALSVGASATGLFRDTTNTDAVVAGDRVCYTWTTGAGGTSYQDRPFFVNFEASSGDVTLLAASESATFSTASSTNPMPLSGTFGAGQTEAHVELKFWKGGTLNKLTVNIATNTRSDTTTLKSRKNGADGNLVISIGANQTGIFTDTTNSDTLADGDLANLTLVLGAGTGSIGVRNTCVAFTSTDACTYLHSAGGQTNISANTTRHLLLTNGTNPATTESDNEAPLGIAGARVSHLRVYVSANTVTATSTATVRRNGADTALTVSIPASTTGEFTDTTNSFTTTAETDWLSLAVVAGATGTTLTVRSLGVLVTTATKLASSLSAGVGATAALTVPKPLETALGTTVALATDLAVAKPLAAALDVSVATAADLAAGAAGASLAVALGASAAATAALDLPKPLAAALLASASVAGDVGVAKPLATILPVTVSGAAGLDAPKPLAAALLVTVVPTGALDVPKPLGVLLPVTATMGADLTVPGVVTGALELLSFFRVSVLDVSALTLDDQVTLAAWVRQHLLSVGPLSTLET